MKRNFFIFILLIMAIIGCEQSDTTSNTQTDTQQAKVNLDELTIHYIDAGQGDATLFQYRDDTKEYNILYDVGDWKRTDVVSYLANLDIKKIDLIAISHPHADHFGQLAEIINTYDVDEVWMSGNESSSKTFQEALEAILASDAAYEEPRTGDSISFGPLTLDILNPSSISGKANEESLAILFTYGENQFLFTGDAGKADEINMLDKHPNLTADIIQLGHHGSKTSSDESFMKQIKPTIAIYSAGVGNSYGHPHEEVISMLNHLNITTYGTDVNGTIIVTSDGQDYEIETSENGKVKAGSKMSDVTSDKEQTDKQSDSNTDCVNLNKAKQDELQTIIHIGSERVEELIKHRPYKNIDELDIIDGIGPSRINDIKEEGKACIGG